jgi:single-stranded DNA-binding protein
MGMEAIGRLHTIFDTKQVSERFSKREFVVEMSDNPKYPQVVLFQLTGDRCSQLEGLNIGDQVRIEFSLRGREWRSPSGETKYFNSLDVWQIEPAGAGNRARSNSGNYARGSYGDRGNGGGNGDSRDVPPARDYEPRPSDLGGSREDDIPF